MIKKHNKLTIIYRNSLFSYSLLFVRFQSLALTCTCVHTRVYFIMICYVHILLQTRVSTKKSSPTPSRLSFSACMPAYYCAHTHTYFYIYTFIHVLFYCYCYSLPYSVFEPCPALCLVHKVNNRKD